MLKTILDEKKQENVLQNCPAYETFLQTARESISGTMKKVETPLLEKVSLNCIIHSIYIVENPLEEKRKMLLMCILATRQLHR